MTLDEAIKKCEEAAEEQDKLSKRYDDASGYSRSHNEAIRTNEAKGHEKCSQDIRQIVECLKELKKFKEKDKPKTVHCKGNELPLCPNCNHEFEIFYERCPECGQRLRWEE